MEHPNFTRRALALAVTSAALFGQVNVQAQTTTLLDVQAAAIEELLVTGRLQTGAQSLSMERMEDPFSADLLGSDQISRVGDSNVAIALTRVTGVTLNQGKYVYVRGLGERYSSVQLNGAQVPSPELTRNVLPLDIIPSSIVESLKVQKSYSPELPSHFGGGNIDIRTKSVPDTLVVDFSIGTGTNSNHGSDNLNYTGSKPKGGLPSEIAQAIDTYQGYINTNTIARTLSGTPAERNAQATQINRELMSHINRDIGINRKKNDIDENLSFTIGNSFDINDEWTVGAIANYSQDSEERSRNQKRANIGSPETIYSHLDRTTEETKKLTSLGLGVDYLDEHNVQLNYFKIEDETQEATITLSHDSNNTLQEGRQRVAYDTRFQDRTLEITQVLGEHTFSQFNNDYLNDIKVDWIYSDSTVETFIPGASNVTGTNQLNPETGELISTAVNGQSAAQFSYLNLNDEVRSYGWNLTLPLTLGDKEVTLKGGYEYNDKARQYNGHTALINFGGGSFLQGTPDQVLSDANVLDTTTNMELAMSRGFGTESYAAAQMLDAFYGMVDVAWNDNLRFTLGARYEDYRSVVIPVDLLDYTGITQENIANNLVQPDSSYLIKEDDLLPSAAMTWSQYDFMNADTFQLRLSYAQTVIRPDLRELSDVIYIDPELNMRVQGNPHLAFSTIDHFDVRGEWYFDNGNNFTATLFYKDIADPIEQKINPGSDSDLVMGFYNAEAGTIYGIELEGLYNFDYGLFASANLTLSDSEIESPAGEGFTNPTREMTGQSPYVLNLQLGYDADNGMHSASIAYNIADEKVYSAAVMTGHQDAYEDVFASLDINYSYYPTENITINAKIRNLLDEKRDITQVNSAGNKVTILSQEIGITSSLEISYKF